MFPEAWKDMGSGQEDQPFTLVATVVSQRRPTGRQKNTNPTKKPPQWLPRKCHILPSFYAAKLVHAPGMAGI